MEPSICEIPQEASNGVTRRTRLVSLFWVSPRPAGGVSYSARRLVLAVERRGVLTQCGSRCVKGDACTTDELAEVTTAENRDKVEFADKIRPTRNPHY